EWGVNDVSPERFRRQLELALSLGFRFVGAERVASGDALSNELAVTFDDALLSVLHNGAPVMAELGIPWTLFVVTDWASGRHSSGRPSTRLCAGRRDPTGRHHRPYLHHPLRQRPPLRGGAPRRLRRLGGMVLTNPLLSVTVLNYNYARFLPGCLDSILRQSFQDFELIVIDDCSTDGSLEVIRPYLSDPRVRL